MGDLVKGRSCSAGDVCSEQWDKLSGWKGLTWRGCRASVRHSQSLVLSWCPFPGPWQVFFSCDCLCCCFFCLVWFFLLCVFENGSAACGTLKERRMKHCFQPEQFLFWRLGWLVSTTIDYRGNDSVTVVITTKIGLCSKWLSVVKSYILRNFPDAFPPGDA